jgi:glycosidase
MADVNWLRNAVIYHVLIDRFNAGDNAKSRQRPGVADQPVFCGGNLQGVTKKLDYLADLGITAIWLSPFTRTAAYHGYHVIDFFRVEDRFGGPKALQKLAKGAHDRGIKLIMDFVPNHVHVSHPFFRRAQRNPNSPYRPWFYWRKGNDYLKFLDFGELAKLNLDYPPAREHVIRAARHWLEQGIDGFRLDHALGPSLDFWQAFRRDVKAFRPNAALFAEVLFAGVKRSCLPTLNLPDKHFYLMAHQLGFDVLDATMKEYADCFDGLLDFTFQKLLKNMVGQAQKELPLGTIQKALNRHFARFPEGCCLLSFLDNHDLNRFAFEAGGDLKRLSRAIEIQFHQKHPPIIYYGTEIGMSQAGPISGPHGDLRARAMMRWDNPNPRLTRTYQKLIRQWKERR